MKKKRKTTRGEFALLIVIILIVFFLPDAYLMIRQRFFSQDLKIYKLSEIKYNLITQSYEPTGDGVEQEFPSQGEAQMQEDSQDLSHEETQEPEDLETSEDSQISEENEAREEFQIQERAPIQAKIFQLVEKKPSQEQVFIVNSQIAIISEDKLSAYSKTGEKKWEAQIHAPEPYIISSKDYIYIINKQKGDIAKLNSNNEITAVVQNLGKITRIKASDDYVVFSTANSNEFKVLDSNLQAYSNFIIPNGDVVDFEISTDSKNIIVNTLHINKYQLESFILTYDIKGKIVGTADINQQIVYSMSPGENMIVVSDTSLISYDKNGSKSSEIPNQSSLIDVCAHKEKVYTLSISDEDSNFTDVNIYSQFLDRLALKELEQTKEGIVANDRFCLIYDYATLELYDNRLNYITKYDIKEAIEQIQWIDEYSFAIIGDGLVNVYEIR